jgi:hypothetical protein
MRREKGKGGKRGRESKYFVLFFPFPTFSFSLPYTVVSNG